MSSTISYIVIDSDSEEIPLVPLRTTTHISGDDSIVPEDDSDSTVMIIQDHDNYNSTVIPQDNDDSTVIVM
jgi:hypothetical protein